MEFSMYTRYASIVVRPSILFFVFFFGTIHYVLLKYRVGAWAPKSASLLSTFLNKEN